MNKVRSFSGRPLRAAALLALMVVLLTIVGVVYADVPGGRLPPRGAVPNPGTQEQELANLTFPAPYNSFEFVVTCAACHGGSIDQQAGHFGNWAGTSMASAARDPIFRANQQIVNQAGIDLGAGDGAGNICIRCHSPNAWYSGRTDPYLAGMGDASNMIHSIVLSTDDEGILCEFCHRTIGNVVMQRDDLDPNDPAWNMMAGITDWPHGGEPFPFGPAAGNPYGDNTMQINDGMTYGGKYPGSANIYFSDVPLTGTVYTGQTYGVYPPGWKDMYGNDVSGQTVVNVDGSTPLHFEAPIGPPLNPDGTPNYQGQAFSPEHTTFDGEFLKSSEFCGSCHDLTIPVLNHGMPEQRTYTEWKYSSFGDSNTRCQDCHMPTMKHEYDDATAVSLNADPLLAGWFPYAKDRNPDGGTAFHKFAGANADLPDIMKTLYPEPDLEVIGAPTGNDTRIFPGMLSTRDPMYDRADRNTEIMLNEAVALDITQVPTEISPGVYEMKVKVTNTSGHKIPSGYPDGRRFWISLQVFDGNSLVYDSGAYDYAQAELLTDSGSTGMNRALEPTIDARVQNAVMIYEKATSNCALNADRTPISCPEPTPNLLNTTIFFDNRIPPAGFRYADYSAAGAKFINYNPATNLPYEDGDRYPEGQNWDEVTYIFEGPAGATLSANAAVLWQTHTREFMDHLLSNNSTVRPEGPPNILDPNYPLTLNYLSDQFDNFDAMTSLAGDPLSDNWGGVAYAAWLETGKGAPYPAAQASTDDTAAPDAPINLAATLIDPFTAEITWDPVANADGYLVWIRYGKDETGATASWDRLAIVYDGTSLTNTAMNVAKTYGFKVQAFNGAGFGPESAPITAQTPIDLPLPPENLMVVGTTNTSVTLSWFDGADNELGFIIQRQDVPVLGDFYTIATIPSQTAGFATGGNLWTDTTAMSGRTYNYRVAAYNDSGPSTWTIAVSASTGGVPSAPTELTATAPNGHLVNLSWIAATGSPLGYRIERSATSANGPWTTTFVLPDPNATSYPDATVQPNTTYWYRVSAYNTVGNSNPSNVATVTTPTAPPPAPTNLDAVAVLDPVQGTVSVELTWSHTGTGEEGFYIERADGAGPDFVWTRIATVGPDTVAFTDDTVNVVSTYSYRVQAFAGGGSAVSDYTNIATVVTPGQAPEAPSELRVSRVTRNSVRITWRDNSTAEQGFYVERSLDGVNFVRIATLGIDVSTYTDRNLSRNTRYWYRVQAFNASGLSAYSETVMATTRR